jgi:hypothetical protein
MDGNLTWLVLLAVGSIYHPLHHLLPCAHIPTPATPAAPPFPLASSCLRRPDTPATRPPSCQPTSTPALHLPGHSLRLRRSQLCASRLTRHSTARPPTARHSPTLAPRGRPPLRACPDNTFNCMVTEELSLLWEVLAQSLGVQASLRRGESN